MNDQELETARRASLEQAQEILSQMEPKTVVEIEGDGTYAFHMNFVETTPTQHPELDTRPARPHVRPAPWVPCGRSVRV